MISKEVMAKAVEILVSNGGSFGEVFLEEKTSLGIQIENKKIEKITRGSIQGAGLRVKIKNKIFYGYTEDVSDKGVLTLARDLSNKEVGASLERPVIISSENKYSREYLNAAEGKDDDLETKIQMMLALDQVAWKTSQYLIQETLVYGEVEQEIYVLNSEGLYVRDSRPRVKMIAQSISSNGELDQSAYEATGALGNYFWLKQEPLKELVVNTVEKSVNLLGAKEAPSGKMAIVLSGEAGGTMVHEACGHGLEADIVKKEMSVYGGHIGEQVASELITVVDDGSMKGLYGSSYYDDEGTKTQKNILIDQGVLKGYMTDKLTAEELEIPITGNGRRESFRDLPITRMTTTYIAPGSHKKEEIISSCTAGLFVRKMGGGQVNTATGDFVFEVSEGYLIENGKIGQQVRGATLIGNGPEVLKTIDMVGDDFGFSLGTCGKDGQGVPVSDAQPTLRIPALTVGGTK